MHDTPIVPTKNTTITLASWNILRGGFKAYNPSLMTASREAGIRRLINDLHTARGVSSLSLIDAYRWNELYSDDAGIARHLGYNSARFVPIDDARITKQIGQGVGLVFATDDPISDSRILDLYNRQGIRTILDVGDSGLQIATVYLDDASEDLRLKQIAALQAGLQQGIPTILMGDFNALRPNMDGSSMSTKLRDIFVRTASGILPKYTNLGATIYGMNQRKVVPTIEGLEFTDADPKKRQTIPAIAPILGLDYLFHNKLVSVDGFTTLAAQGQSDHLPIMASATFR